MNFNAISTVQSRAFPLLLALVVGTAASPAFAKKNSADANAPLLSTVQMSEANQVMGPVLPSAILIRTLADDVAVIVESGAPLGISISGASRTKDSKDLAALLNQDSSAKSLPNGGLELDLKPSGIYHCSLNRSLDRTSNGAIESVSGTCLTGITIDLPNFASVKVYLNGKLVSGPMNFQDLSDALPGASYDNDKLNLIQKYLISAQNKLSMSQVEVLLKSFSFDEGRMAACQLMSGKVGEAVDGGTIGMMFSFDADRERAVDLLSR